MTGADAIVDLSSPDDCLDGLLDVTFRLTLDFGLSITWDPLCPTVCGRYFGPSRSVSVNTTATIGDQLWLLIQVWTYLAIGPDAVPDARITPGLRVIKD